MNAEILLDKDTLALKIPCDQRTAQRILDDLHESGELFIVRWIRRKGSAIPVYHKKFPGCGKDAVKPVAKTAVEKSRERRKNIKVAEREAAEKRNNRRLKAAPFIAQSNFLGIKV